MTGFSRQAFMLLELVCFPEESIIRRVGTPSSIYNRGKLGLYLFFVGSRMSVKHLYLIFGLVQTSACVYINEMLKLVVRKLKKHPVSAIRYPTDDILIEWAALVHHRGRRVSNVAGFVDGLALHVQCNDNIVEQISAYNGYHHDTTCNNVLAFAPTGKVFSAALNYPWFFS